MGATPTRPAPRSVPLPRVAPLLAYSLLPACAARAATKDEEELNEDIYNFDGDAVRPTAAETPRLTLQDGFEDADLPEDQADDANIVESGAAPDDPAHAQANAVRVTTPYMTKYERARVLGTRALQISCVGASY